MGKHLGLGAKSGCGFFIPKSKMASKMATKKMNFLFSHIQELKICTNMHIFVVLLRSNLKSIIML